MFNIFKAVGDRMMGDLKKKAVKIGIDLLKQIEAMAKALDLDNNGVKDWIQARAAGMKIVAVYAQVFALLRDAGALVWQAILKAQEANPAFAELAMLCGLYYIKFGPQKPTAVVAQLEAQQQHGDIEHLLPQRNEVA